MKQSLYKGIGVEVVFNPKGSLDFLMIRPVAKGLSLLWNAYFCGSISTGKCSYYYHYCKFSSETNETLNLNLNQQYLKFTSFLEFNIFYSRFTDVIIKLSNPLDI